MYDERRGVKERGGRNKRRTKNKGGGEQTKTKEEKIVKCNPYPSGDMDRVTSEYI